MGVFPQDSQTCLLHRSKNFKKYNAEEYPEYGNVVYRIYDDYLPNKNEGTWQNMFLQIESPSGLISLDIAITNGYESYVFWAELRNGKTIDTLRIDGPVMQRQKNNIG